MAVKRVSVETGEWRGLWTCQKCTHPIMSRGDERMGMGEPTSEKCVCPSCGNMGSLVYRPARRVETTTETDVRVVTVETKRKTIVTWEVK